MGRPNPAKTKTKFIRQRRLRESRAERFQKHHAKLETCRALKETHEQLGNFDEVTRLSVRIRTLEQMLKYMGQTYEEVLNDTG